MTPEDSKRENSEIDSIISEMGEPDAAGSAGGNIFAKKDPQSASAGTARDTASAPDASRDAGATPANVDAANPASIAALLLEETIADEPDE